MLFFISEPAFIKLLDFICMSLTIIDPEPIKTLLPIFTLPLIIAPVDI